MSLLILTDDSSKGTYVSSREEGYFFLHLTPGGYTIAAFEGRLTGLSSYDKKSSNFAQYKSRKARAARMPGAEPEVRQQL